VFCLLTAIGCRTGSGASGDAEAGRVAKAFVTVLAPTLPSGSLIAHVAGFVPGKPVRRLAFWRVVGPAGAESVSEAVFLQALGTDRRSWPQQTVQFSVLEAGRSAGLVDARFLYQRGLAAGSRGGRIERIHLHRAAAGWRITERETRMHAD
jgi:hypothetical protein